MKVSILMPLYNAKDYVAEAIQSALNQSWQNKEIIIVDDGSTDGSYEIAKSYEFAIVKVFRQENKGAPSARNYAFSKCSGDYIQYLDADDLMSENKIESQLLKLKDYNFDADFIASCGWIEYTDADDTRLLTKRETIVARDYEPAYLALIDYWKSSYPSIPYHNYLTHRSKILSAGLWREDLKKNQDSEFFARVISDSRKLVYTDNVMVYYRDVASSISKPSSIEKVYSEYLSTKLITEIILNKSNNADAVYACSLKYTEFIESRYPLNKEFLKEVYNDISKYNLSFITSHRGRLYRLTYKLAGWKAARAILKPYNLLKRTLKFSAKK